MPFSLYKLGTAIFCADALIILVGGIIFQDFNGVIYGLIVNYLYAIVADKLLYCLPKDSPTAQTAKSRFPEKGNRLFSLDHS